MTVAQDPDDGIVPRLETSRLLLRGHRRSDFTESAAMWADPKVVVQISGTPSSREDSWSRLLRYRGHWSWLGFGYWVVEAKEGGRFLGEVGFADYRRAMRPSLEGMPESGWVLKSAEHGKGFATEAVSRILDWAGGRPGFEKTVCILAPEHVASIAVARKVGYAEETMGTYRGQPTLVMSRSDPAAPDVTGSMPAR
ncbi:GNAT family N-acetyltransferase [Algihabitans albus]|uniref:GNAT family N-acetyltransferase n=1 Tax=Algihabitans albus TaxID=2164067 RepID=UPI001ABD3612|nr:GNAT family protein [Algihabitans albus]